MKDSFDQVVTCQSVAALKAYDHAVDCQLHAWPGAPAAIERALEHDPDFALAHSTRALLLLSAGRGAEAREASKQALLLAKALTEREQSHLGIVNLILEGRAAAALTGVRAHAEQWPRDALVMSLALGAFGLIAFSGQADHDQQRFDFVQKIASKYPTDHPWLLSHQGWVLIETNQPEAGLPFVSRSLELRPANGNAAHVMMHAKFELNDPERAMDFSHTWLSLYPDTAMLFGHIHWHTALCELQLGQTAAAVNRLLTIIEPHLAHAPGLVGMTDTTSLLWRLKLERRRKIYARQVSTRGQCFCRDPLSHAGGWYWAAQRPERMSPAFAKTRGCGPWGSPKRFCLGGRPSVVAVGGYVNGTPELNSVRRARSDLGRQSRSAYCYRTNPGFDRLSDEQA